MHDDLEADSLIPIFQLKFCLYFSWADVNFFSKIQRDERFDRNKKRALHTEEMKKAFKVNNNNNIYLTAIGL